MPRDIYFGGSFNPFHRGHARIIAEILERCKEGKIVVDPVLDHIWSKDLMPFADRCAIAECAIANHPRIHLNKIPVTGTNGSTFQALEFLVDNGIISDHASIVVGGDNAARIKEWYEWEELVDNHEFIIVTREQSKFDPNLFPCHKIIRMSETVSSTFIREAMARGFYEAARDCMGKNSFMKYLTLTGH